MNASFPPDPRYGISSLLSTSGQPANNIGSDGDLASDPNTGDAYIKANGVWLFLVPTV